MNIYLDDYYLELSTGLIWRLVNVKYNTCELENEDTAYYVTLDELNNDFERVKLTVINKENIIVKPY